MNATLTVSHLSHSFAGRQSVEALKDISFELENGITALVGKNGSGKSTLFRLLSGLLPVQSGTIRFFGAMSPVETRRAGLLGLSFQHPSLDQRLTVWENLQHHSLLYGVQLNRKMLNGIVPGILEIDDVLEKKVETLSGGFQRRVELAKILTTKPRLLLLDEPFNGLDLPVRDAFFSMLRHISQEQTIPVFLITHDMELAGQCNSAIVLEEGRVLFQDSPRKMLERFGETVIEIESHDVESMHRHLSILARGKSYLLPNGKLLVTALSIAELFDALGDQHRSVRHVDIRKPLLADFFSVQAAQKPKQIEERSVAA